MPLTASQSNDVAPSESFVTFVVDRWKLALPLESVERVLPIMEFLPLPGAPPAVMGVFRIDGAPIPVVDLRTVLRARPIAVQPEDVLLLAKTSARRVALWVDSVEGVTAIARDQLQESEPLLGENCFIREMTSHTKGLILIYNLEELLSVKEESLLAEALESLERKESST